MQQALQQAREGAAGADQRYQEVAAQAASAQQQLSAVTSQQSGLQQQLQDKQAEVREGVGWQGSRDGDDVGAKQSSCGPVISVIRCCCQLIGECPRPASL